MKETLNTAQNPLCTIPSVGGSAFINDVTCIDWQDGIKQVLDNSVDLVITDPPYGMKFQSNYRKVKHKSIQNDDNLDWLGGWCKQLKRVCKDEAHIYVFCSLNYFNYIFIIQFK